MDNFLSKEIEILKSLDWLIGFDYDNFFNNKEISNIINLSTSPIKENIFNALKSVPYNKAKVLILGQDPYPNPKDAHGFAFSSRNNVTPGSLKNIFLAIDKVYNSHLFEKKYNVLTNWVNQGVVLLNTSLTFEKKEDKKCQQQSQNIHLKLWKPFINHIILRLLSKKDQPVVFFLWGDKAQKLVESNIKKINLSDNILILKSTHPSPLSVNRGGDFPELAPKHFILCNEFLEKHNAKAVEWSRL